MNKYQMTIKKALHEASIKLTKISTTPALDAEVLLLYILRINRTQLLSNLDKVIMPAQIKRFNKLVARRKKREPVAYIIQNQSFYGIDFYVDKRVLIPRPETELMVDIALNLLRNKETKKLKNKLKLVDIGTGSGCIPISLAINFKDAKYFATDISKNALQVTTKNLVKYNLKSKVKLLHGDLLAPLKGKFDIITANLPYLTIEQIKATEIDVRRYEPHMALLAGKTETTLYEKLLSQAPRYLNKNGYLLLEIDPLFSKQTITLIKQYFPKASYEIKKDLAGKERVLIIKNSA